MNDTVIIQVIQDFARDFKGCKDGGLSFIDALSKKIMNTVDEEVRLYEPQSALTDNADGLVFYRRLIELCQKAEKKLVLFAEILFV